MTTIEYKIGKLHMRITSHLDLSGMSLYKPFVVEPVLNSPQISIKIDRTAVMNIENFYNANSKNLHCSLTYTWIVKGSHHYMLFSKRLQKLLESALSDIWILECNDDFSECVLHIPFCTETSEIMHEIVIRPWLQRLFIARSWKSNFAVFHGALIDIDGTGVVFLGDSGSGKSTMCDLINTTKATVIADDRFILDSSGALVCFGTPWNIKNPHYSINMSSKLSKLFILSHGSNQIKDISNSYHEMTHDLLPSMLFPPFISSVEALTHKIKWLNLIKNNCEIYSFAFKPDVSALSYISNTKGLCQI